MRPTILRQWLVLTMLPRPPRRIDTAAIEAGLRERGFDVHRRTIQRDLIELAAVFPIVVDERAKPYGWRWSDDAQAISVPMPRLGAAARFFDVVLRVRRPELVVELPVKQPRTVEGTVVGVMDDTPSVRRELLARGMEVEIVSPLALRREIVAAAQEILANYGVA